MSMSTLGLIALGLCLVLLLLERYSRRMLDRQSTGEPVIVPLSARHYRYVGHDEALVENSLRRRAAAAKLRKRAAGIDSGR